jgi:hypothetical protein
MTNDQITMTNESRLPLGHWCLVIGHSAVWFIRTFAFSGEALQNGGMTERKPFPLMPAILTALALLLGAYVVSYLRIGTRNVVRATDPVPMVAGVVRLYPHKWQVAAYQPAAYVESLCIGAKVYLGDYETYGDPYEEETYGTPAYHAKYGDPDDEANDQ